MSQATMVNLITKDTSKEKILDNYKDYPTTTPKGGFESFHMSTVEPILCEIPAGAKVLDVGCNSGALMELLNQKGCKAYGVDVSDKLVRECKAKRLKVRYADAASLPFNDKKFDVVVMREVLVHLLDPVAALKEIKRVLKPGGFLIGSTPHANLERIVWDDKRLHHRYYDEARLTKDLSAVFETNHLRVLTGAQFSIGFSSSMLSDQPAEMLFKCGDVNTLPWDGALLADKETLRVWMGPTQPPGDAYYRMIGFAEKMRNIKGVEIGYEQFNWNSDSACSEWQRKVLMNEKGEPASVLALDQLEKCLRVTDPWVFQVSQYDDIIALFEGLKEAYPEKKLITECDDWLFDLPAYNVASNPYRPNSPAEKVAFRQIELSDAVVVSTFFLKESILKMFPEKSVHVVPNGIDFEMWDPVKGDGKMAAKGDGVIRIGYTGCGNHGGDMEIVKPVLLALLNEFPNLEVVIAQDYGCFKGLDHPRLKIVNRWTNIIEYPAMVKGWDLDIGIAPLRDNAFNRAKSNLRWLEYSALKIPTVASRVRPFAESITDLLTGELCLTKDQWYISLKKLIESDYTRKVVGENAYAKVKADFNMQTIAEKYAALLKEIRNGR